MDATGPQPPHADDSRALAVQGHKGRAGDRAALGELGKVGGRVRAERLARRKAEEAAAVVLTTVTDMRGFLERRAGEVEASDEAATAKAGAAARLVTALTALDGLAELARENERLRIENAILRAGGGGDRTVTLSWGESDGPVHTPSPAGTVDTTPGATP